MLFILPYTYSYLLTGTLPPAGDDGGSVPYPIPALSEASVPVGVPVHTTEGVPVLGTLTVVGNVCLGQGRGTQEGQQEQEQHFQGMKNVKCLWPVCEKRVRFLSQIC